VDAVAFLALDEVFAAMMTGNVLFLGFGVAGSAGASLAGPLIAMGAFLVGSAAGSLLAARAVAFPRRGLPIAIAIEAALLGSAALIAAVVTVEEGEGAAYTLLAIVALAMGLRGTVARRIGFPELGTIVVTVALTRLEVGSPDAAASRERLATRGMAIAAIVAGAAAGALLLKESVAAALALAAAVGCVAFIAAAASPPDPAAGASSPSG
jgi:uncharacterized membrane protein YoaK (UPF0700 family)